mmetsp:Transcript_117444/g.292806  ORF Transcript_117444/g.292806 Transcript_117444/m.292806 type:complete len:210 (+) Transcript_117444:81-710(+)
MGCAAGVCPRTRRWMYSRCCAGVPGLVRSRGSSTRQEPGWGGTEVEHIRAPPSSVDAAQSQAGNPPQAIGARPLDDFPAQPQAWADRHLPPMRANQESAQDSGDYSDCDTDPDMPDLVPAPVYSPPGSAGSQTTLLGTPECEAESPALGTWMEKRGGLDSCWGSNALKNALNSMDDEDGTSPSDHENGHVAGGHAALALKGPINDRDWS